MMLFVQIFSESIVGAFNEEGDDHDGGDDDNNGDEAKVTGGGNYYEVIGTMSDPMANPPSWAKEIIQVRFICNNYYYYYY